MHRSAPPVTEAGDASTNGGVRRNIDAMTNRSRPQPYDRSTTMNVRPLIAAVAFVSLAAPLAAHADAPSGEINTIFAIDPSGNMTAPEVRSSRTSHLRRRHPGSADVDDAVHGDARAGSQGARQDAAGARRRLRSTVAAASSAADRRGAPSQGAPHCRSRRSGRDPRRDWRDVSAPAGPPRTARRHSPATPPTH